MRDKSLVPATRDIRAGEELFCDYGEGWLDGYDDDVDEEGGGGGGARGFAKHVPRKTDYQQASVVFHKMMTSFQEVEGEKRTSSNSNGNGNDNNSRSNSYPSENKNIEEESSSSSSSFLVSDNILNTIKEITTQLNPRVGSLLPNTTETYTSILDKSGKKKLTSASAPASASNRLKFFDAIIDQSLLHQTRIHDAEWILQNGICIHRLRSDISTIPGAGRGAFANEFIAKGEVIAPAPLLLIADESMLDMYDLDWDEEEGRWKDSEEMQVEMVKMQMEQEKQNNMKDEGNGTGTGTGTRTGKVPDMTPVGKQLIMNYCFGSKFTQLLLCPQSNIILINHQGNRRKDTDSTSETKTDGGPNARIQWAYEWDESTEPWLHKPIDEIVNQIAKGKRGLSMEVIATRDIQPHEEVLMDYGAEWEEAWDEHVMNFQPPPVNVDAYTPLKELMDTKAFRRIVEMGDGDEDEEQRQSSPPYPDNVELVCYIDNFDVDDGSAHNIVESDRVDTQYYPCEIAKMNFRYLIEGEDRWDEAGEESSSTSSKIYYYTVQIPVVEEKEDSSNSSAEVEEEEMETYYEYDNYPETSLMFRIKPYHSDVHLPHVFRHHIELPVDMIPIHWMYPEVQEVAHELQKR